MRRRWAWERWSNYHGTPIAHSGDHQTLYGANYERRTPHSWRKHPRTAHSSENEQTPTTTMLQSYTCSFSDECDSAPPAYPSLIVVFLWRAEKNREPEMPWGDERSERGCLSGCCSLPSFLEKGSRERDHNTTKDTNTCPAAGFVLLWKPQRCTILLIIYI